MFKIESDFKNANIPRTVRFTDQLFDRLNELSSKHAISFNFLVLQCCKYALDNLDESDLKAKTNK